MILMWIIWFWIDKWNGKILCDDQLSLFILYYINSSGNSKMIHWNRLISKYFVSMNKSEQPLLTLNVYLDTAYFSENWKLIVENTITIFLLMAKHYSHYAVGLRFSLFVCNNSVGSTLKTCEQCLMMQNALPKHTLNLVCPRYTWSQFKCKKHL